MKYSITELEKAISKVKETGGAIDVNVMIDPMNRIILSYTDMFDGDQIAISVYTSDIQKMPTITKTTRL